jgi:small multidrug resistance pump
MNSWLILIAAIVCEVIGTSNLKLSDGFTVLLPSTMVLVFYGTSFYLFSLALREIDVGVAYAVWSGLGTALIVTLGVALYREEMSPERAFWLSCIIAGVVGLHLSGGGH